MEKIVTKARDISKIINKIINTNKSDKYIEILLIPFLCHLESILVLKKKKIKAKGLIFTNFAEFYKFYWTDIFYGETNSFERQIEWEEGSFDCLFNSKLNLYEKIVFKCVGIKYAEIKFKNELKKIEEQANEKLRIKLLEDLQNIKINDYTEVVENIPISLFENLKNLKNEIYPSSKVVWLGQIHNEEYLKFIADRIISGNLIIGQVHGGAFSQIEREFGNEKAERILSDIYCTPDWLNKYDYLPNQRASRNIFLNIKNKKIFKENKYLIILSYYIEDNHILNEMLFRDGMTHSELYDKLLGNLKNYFNCDFDFKMHPLQKDAAEKFKYLQIKYKNSKLIFGSSVQKLSSSYKGVIHFEPWATSVIELASSDVRQFVYTSNKMKLNLEFKKFILNSNSIKEDTYIEDKYIEIDNCKFRKAYNAKWLYPFVYAKFIKNLS